MKLSVIISALFITCLITIPIQKAIIPSVSATKNEAGKIKITNHNTSYLTINITTADEVWIKDSKTESLRKNYQNAPNQSIVISAHGSGRPCCVDISKPNHFLKKFTFRSLPM